MVAVVLCSCNDLLDGKDNPYEGTTRELTVRLVYPKGHPDREGGSARVTLEDVDRGTVYTASAGNDDMARFEVAFGIYRVSARDRGVGAGCGHLFQRRARSDDRLCGQRPFAAGEYPAGGFRKPVKSSSRRSDRGGCKKDPLEGTYQSDKYVILYNNSEKVAYLDNICFGTVDPYNAYGTNVWLIADPETGEKSFRDYRAAGGVRVGFSGRRYGLSARTRRPGRNVHQRGDRPYVAVSAVGRSEPCGLFRLLRQYVLYQHDLPSHSGG